MQWQHRARSRRVREMRGLYCQILVFLSFVPTVLGFGLYSTSMNHIPASIANLLATLEPVLTAVEAYVFLDERMTIIQIAGSLVVLSAVVVVQLEKE